MKLYVILLIIVVILVITICYLKYTKIKDYKVRFLSKKESCDIIKSSDYFNNFTEYDLMTRNLKNKNKSYIIKHYCNQIREFTLNEKKALKWILKKIIVNNDKLLISDWNFIKFNNIENNFPHTHLDCIFLSDNMIKDITYHYDKKSSLYKMNNLINTIIHEKVHVFQRQNEVFFQELYNLWNFKKAKIDNLEKYLKYLRNNPDSVKSFYVFSYKGQHIWFDALFNKDAKDLSDTEYIGVYLEKNNIGFKATDRFNKLKNIEIFNDYFGNIKYNYYHPNEITSE